MAALSEKANDAVFHIDEDDNDNDDGKDANDIEQETGAEAAEGEDDEDDQVVSDDESRFRAIADSIWSWPRPTVHLQ